MTQLYSPDFTEHCHVCGHSPTVVVNGHVQPSTQLCGVHFWQDRRMIDWELWNDKEEDSE